MTSGNTSQEEKITNIKPEGYMAAQNTSQQETAAPKQKRGAKKASHEGTRRSGLSQRTGIRRPSRTRSSVAIHPSLDSVQENQLSYGLQTWLGESSQQEPWNGFHCCEKDESITAGATSTELALDQVSGAEAAIRLSDVEGDFMDDEVNFSGSLNSSSTPKQGHM
ncbi:MAG: hypothetical protein M1834_000549 [Cirrosporium novae-zelandiae]|nr:MAG: hypothetical protein M1834_000549 [Cirrosporium novae-zelandiae]